MARAPTPRRVTVVPRAAVTTHTSMAEQSVSPAPKPEPPSDPDARQAAIAAAIRRLDPEDPTHMTEGGKPDATVLSDLLGWRVSAEERDAVWEDVLGSGDRSRTRQKE